MGEPLYQIILNQSERTQSINYWTISLRSTSHVPVCLLTTDTHVVQLKDEDVDVTRWIHF